MGVHQWTVGQRVGINKDENSYFVVSKNSETNEILLANDSHHPALYSESFFTGAPHWIASPPEGVRSGTEAEFRFQNMQPLTAVTPGQYAVFYQGDVCLGSAEIERPGPSLYTLNSKGCRTKILENLKAPTL